MYAIIQSGGRQVKVEPGVTVAVDHRPDQAGEAITFDKVLFIGHDDGGFVAGAPHVAGATVTGIVDGVVQDKKIRVFTKKRRGGMRRTLGHRTRRTQVRITGIDTA